MGEDEVLQASAIEKKLLEQYKLFFIREEGLPSGLMSALSLVFFSSDARASELQALAVNSFKSFPEFSRYRMKSQIEYQMTPSIAEFDHINLKLIASLRKTAIRVWYLNAGELCRDSINGDAQKEVHLFRNSSGTIFPLVTQAQKEFSLFAKKLITDMVDALPEKTLEKSQTRNESAGLLNLLGKNKEKIAGSKTQTKDTFPEFSFFDDTLSHVKPNNDHEEKTFMSDFFSNFPPPRESAKKNQKQQNFSSRTIPQFYGNQLDSGFSQQTVNRQMKSEQQSNAQTKINIQRMNFNIQNQYDNAHHGNPSNQNDFYFRMPSPSSSRFSDNESVSGSSQQREPELPSGSHKLLNTLAFKPSKNFLEKNLKNPQKKPCQNRYYNEAPFDPFEKHFHEDRFSGNQQNQPYQFPAFTHFQPQKAKQMNDIQANLLTNKRPKMDLSNKLLKGHIKSFDEEKGFGFLEVTTSEFYKTEVFVYRTQLEEAGLTSGFLRTVRQGNVIPLYFEVVYYESKKYGLCKKAVNLKVAAN